VQIRAAYVVATILTMMSVDFWITGSGTSSQLFWPGPCKQVLSLWQLLIIEMRLEKLRTRIHPMDILPEETGSNVPAQRIFVSNVDRSDLRRARKGRSSLRHTPRNRRLLMHGTNAEGLRILTGQQGLAGVPMTPLGTMQVNSFYPGDFRKIWCPWSKWPPGNAASAADPL